MAVLSGASKRAAEAKHGRVLPSGSRNGLSMFKPIAYNVCRLLIGVVTIQLALGCAQPRPRGSELEAAGATSRRADGLTAAREAEAGLAGDQPIEPPTPYSVAKSLRRRGELKASLEAVIDVLGQQPETYRQADGALTEKADADVIKRLAEAARVLSEERPENVAAGYLYGRLLAKAGQNEAALEQLAAAVRLDPQFGPSSAALAEVYVKRKEWESAVKAAQEATAAGLHDAELYILEGHAHDALDEVEEAESAWMEAFAQNRKSADGLYLLAESLERRGRRQRCEELYGQILEEVGSRHVPAREKLFLIYLNSGRLEKAKECFAAFGKLGITGPAVERCKAMLDLADSQLPEGRLRLTQYQADLNKIAAKYPDDVGTHLALAMSCLAVADYAQALKSTDLALSLDSENLRAREFKALLEARLLRFKAAAAVMEGLLKDRPRDTGYQEKLLELAKFGADYDTAAKVLRELLDKESDDNRRKLRIVQLLDVLVAAGRFDEAVRTAKDWMEESPSDAARRDAYLTALTRAGRRDEAVEVMGRYLNEDPTSPRLRMRYVAQLQAARRYVEAEQQVLSWLANDPDDVDLNRLLISLLWSAKQWDGAIEVAQTGAELAEHRTTYENLLGQSYVLAGRFDQAIEFYRGRAARLQTESAYQDLVAVLIRAERLADAEQLVNKLLAPDLERLAAGRPYDAALTITLRRQLARIYELMGRQEQAVQQLEAIHELASDDPGVNNDLGFTYADAGIKLEQAERMVRLAVAQQPEEAAFLDSLGWVMYKQGRFDEAVYYLRLAIRKSDEEDAAVLDHLGDALYRAGRGDDAKECWEKAVKLTEPDSDPPPSTEDRRLHELAQAKLGRLAAKEEPNLAAVVGLGVSTQPAATTQP